MSFEDRYNGGLPPDPDRDHFVDEDGNFDIVRFIVQTTNEVWDQQRFDRVCDYFAEEFVSHGAEGREFGDRSDLYDYALPRTSAFPDTKVLVDDLIWTGDEERGFKTSHSFTVTGTNAGPSEHGPPTGKRLRLTGIANCTVERIDGEWKYTEERAEDDQFAILRACRPGEPETYPELPDDEIGDDSDVSSGTPVGERDAASSIDIHTKGEVRTGAFDPVTHLQTLLHEVWNDRAVGTIEKYYAEDVRVEAASGRRLRTTDELRTEVLERLGAFPDLAVAIEEMMVVEDGDGYRSSIAYSATGTHNGPSKYGTASGTEVTFTGHLNQTLRQVGDAWRVVHCREDFDERRLMRLLA